MKEEIQARLIAKGFSDITPARRKYMVKWLRFLADEIQKANPKEYIKNMRWTLYK